MYLLDTHAVIWLLADDPRVPERVRSLFLEGTAPMFVSAASIWEMSIKASLGKLQLSRPLRELDAELVDQGIPVLGVESRHAVAVQHLPFHHRDPFDRVLAATAMVDSFALVSSDVVFDRYGVERLWD